MAPGENKCICGPMSACIARGRREQADCRFHRFVDSDSNCAHLRKTIELRIDGITYFHCDNVEAQRAARCPDDKEIDIEQLEAERKEGIVATMENSDDDEELKEIRAELYNAIDNYMRGGK